MSSTDYYFKRLHEVLRNSHDIVAAKAKRIISCCFNNSTRSTESKIRRKNKFRNKIKSGRKLIRVIRATEKQPNHRPGKRDLVYYAVQTTDVTKVVLQSSRIRVIYMNNQKFSGLLSTVQKHQKTLIEYNNFISKNECEPAYYLKYDDDTYCFVKLLADHILIDENGNFHSFSFYTTPVSNTPDHRFNILSPKFTTKAILFNTKTASTTEHVNRLVELLIDERADLMMVNEHCRYFTDEPGHVKYMAVGDGFTFIHLSATKNGRKASVGGVGILCSPGAAKMVRRAEKVSDRILRVDFNSASTSPNHSAQGWPGPFEKGMPFCLFDEKGKSILQTHFAFFPKMT